MKIKFNQNKTTYTVKGLTIQDLYTIAALMANVKLGLDTGGSRSCGKIGDFLEIEGFDFLAYNIVASDANGNQIEDFSLEFV